MCLEDSVIESPLDKNKLEFALDVIEMVSEKEDDFRAGLRAALVVLSFGGITIEQMIRHLEPEPKP